MVTEYLWGIMKGFVRCGRGPGILRDGGNFVSEMCLYHGKFFTQVTKCKQYYPKENWQNHQAGRSLRNQLVQILDFTEEEIDSRKRNGLPECIVITEDMAKPKSVDFWA